MKAHDLKILRQAAKILRREFPKKQQCKTFVWDCIGCRLWRAAEEYESFAVDFIVSEEEQEKYLKKYEKEKKRIEANNPK